MNAANPQNLKNTKNYNKKMYYKKHKIKIIYKLKCLTFLPKNKYKKKI